uniref:Core-binding (CB) domain-containing protein n=1 Tax=Lepisosteus oculatus TaxID=7918 RepID=W5LVK3_LEPOC
MDQTAPSLNFVKDIRKTRDFFNEMKTIGLSHQTIANYIKNINRFLRYILNATNVRVMDPTLANFIINFQSILKDVQRKNSKDVTQEITRKRYRQLQQPEPNTTECWKVLRVAKKDVLHVLGKTYSSEEITGAEQLLVMYYLQAVLQLKHLQRPGVVKNMTVRIPSYNIKSKCYTHTYIWDSYSVTKQFFPDPMRVTPSRIVRKHWGKNHAGIQG